jgi:cell pole-organizing protein PopZ
VTGDVVGPDVMKGLAEVLRRRQFDEIIVSTLPPGVSRWLHQDLPHRVERKFGLPVTVVTAPKPSAR